MAKQNRWHSAILVPALLGSMAVHAQGNSAAMATPDFKTQDQSTELKLKYHP